MIRDKCNCESVWRTKSSPRARQLPQARVAHSPDTNTNTITRHTHTPNSTHHGGPASQVVAHTSAKYCERRWGRGRGAAGSHRAGALCDRGRGPQGEWRAFVEGQPCQRAVVVVRAAHTHLHSWRAVGRAARSCCMCIRGFGGASNGVGRACGEHCACLPAGLLSRSRARQAPRSAARSSPRGSPDRRCCAVVLCCACLRRCSRARTS